MPSDTALLDFFNRVDRQPLSASELRDAVRNARNPGYWRALNPALTAAGISHKPVSARRHSAAIRQIDDYGYFQIDDVIASSVTRRMKLAMERVRAAGWPAVFAMVYNEFWNIAQIPPIDRVLEEVLGSGYLQIPHVWCHYVRPVAGAHGWSPHVDGKRSGRMSIWLPLSDATLENGCMYVIPDGRVSDGFDRTFKMRRSFSKDERDMMFHGMRALPAPAGSILGWHFGMIHWGGMAENGRHPRVSVAYEFIQRGQQLMVGEVPLFDQRSGPPSFDERLKVIGRAILEYRKFEPRLSRFEKLAKKLV